MARIKKERNISYDDVRKKYYVNMDFGLDPETGKQIKKTQTFIKLSEARIALRKHEGERDAGKTVLPKVITLTQWLNSWMEDVVKLSKSATTIYGYERIIEKHITPVLGDVPLQKLTPQQLQQYYASKIRGKELSSNSVRKHHDMLNTALKLAVKQGLLSDNPVSRVEAPQVKPAEISYYSMEQLQTLFQLAEGTRIGILIKLAGLLGLSREEIMGLTWDCVDFNSKKIEIRSVRTSAGDQIITKEPKTSTSRRTLHMTSDLEALLLKEQEIQLSYHAQLGDAYEVSGYVFTHENGRPVRPNYASDLFTKFIRDHNLPPLTLHGLRHSFASIANAKGIPMFDIGKALGHSSPATTSKIYTHLLDPDHKNLLETMWDKN